MNFEVKELTKEILDTSTLFLETLSTLRDTGNISLENQINILNKINSQNGHIFVAITKNNEIIGTTTVLIEQKFIRNGAKVAHIEDVSTNKNFQGSGIGKAIIQASINFAKEQGCYKIILDADDKVKGFYEKFNFHISENHLRLDL